MAHESIATTPEVTVDDALGNLLTSFLRRNGTPGSAIYAIPDVPSLVQHIKALIQCPVCSRAWRLAPYPEYQIKLQKLEQGAKVPLRHHDNDAGFDLYSLYTIDLPPMEVVEVQTGFALEMADCLYATIEGRSSFNRQGIIVLRPTYDAGFRGPVSALMMNLSPHLYTIQKWEKFAQMIFHYRLPIKISAVNELNPSERGQGKYGSSGKF